MSKQASITDYIITLKSASGRMSDHEIHISSDRDITNIDVQNEVVTDFSKALAHITLATHHISKVRTLSGEQIYSVLKD